MNLQLVFQRKEYKREALKKLKGRWSTPVIANLITLLLFYFLSVPVIGSSLGDITGSFSPNSNVIVYSHQQGSNSTSFIISIIEFFITGVLTIASANLYITLDKTQEKLSLSTWFTGFAYWLNGFLGQILISVFVFLWSLLLIFPGIIKALSYSQMFYILAENPDVGVFQALKLSKKMTNGYKGKLFTMYLSFIGWDVLCILTGGILALWIVPYKNMSFTIAYQELKQNALYTGSIRAEELV